MKYLDICNVRAASRFTVDLRESWILIVVLGLGSVVSRIRLWCGGVVVAEAYGAYFFECINGVKKLENYPKAMEAKANKFVNMGEKIIQNLESNKIHHRYVNRRLTSLIKIHRNLTSKYFTFVLLTFWALVLMSWLT